MARVPVRPDFMQNGAGTVLGPALPSNDMTQRPPTAGESRAFLHFAIRGMNDSRHTVEDSIRGAALLVENARRDWK